MKENMGIQPKNTPEKIFDERKTLKTLILTLNSN